MAAVSSFASGSVPICAEACTRDQYVVRITAGTGIDLHLDRDELLQLIDELEEIAHPSPAETVDPDHEYDRLSDQQLEAVQG